MGFISEFKTFAAKGNVVDLAVGIIIGSAFGKVVTSVVEDLAMPFINPLLPQGDWKTLEVGPHIRIGSFLGNLLDFLIVAFVVFVIIRALNAFRRKNEPNPEETPPTPDVVLLTEIRDLLKK